MKVVFTGGKTGGHFYPLIAIAEELRDIADAEHVTNGAFYFFSSTPYDERSLSDMQIHYVHVPAGMVTVNPRFSTIRE